MLAPPSVDPTFSPSRRGDAAGLLARRGVTGRYIVAVGGASRRNLKTAIAAWEASRASVETTLVVVGKEVPAQQRGVVHLGRIDDAVWAAVLAGATALCYPTRFEGYGMPALEAAASGVPVVCAQVGPLPEVLGDAAEWCDPNDVLSVTAALTRVLGDGGRRGRLRQLGLQRAATAPSWADSAAVVLDAYQRAEQS